MAAIHHLTTYMYNTVDHQRQYRHCCEPYKVLPLWTAFYRNLTNREYRKCPLLIDKHRKQKDNRGAVHNLHHHSCSSDILP